MCDSKEPFLSVPENSPPGETRQVVSSQLLHDLRTPLNQIIGYSELLGEQLKQDALQPETRDELLSDATKIRGAGKYLLSLLETHFQGEKRDVSTPLAADESETEISSLPGIVEKMSQAQAVEYSCLIVDDNESNRDVLARRLSRQKLHIEMAQNGREALDKVRAQSFDVMLLDIMMPEMDGYEVLRQMKADAVLRHIPVIMISALNEMDSVVRCIEMGAEDYLCKPFSPTLLRARIGACLDKKRAHDREAQLLAQSQENYAQLRRIEQQRDDLMHMIIHDLRSPLSSNIAGIEMVEMLGPLSEEQRDCLSIAMRSGHNLLDLINDLLDIAKMESGGLSLELQSCAAAYLAAVAADQISPLLGDKELTLTRDIAPNLPAMLADESKLRRVFVNILANAVKFTPRGGHITFSARAEAGFVLFSVQDTGEGIPQNALKQIFEKFRQVENRKSGRQNSSGLGLAYCKLAVDAHGGRIWAQSTPGIGSTFFFTIPSLASQANADA